ncbi:MAG: signal peptide peptidase SppA [Planctomycetota bacterium]
MNARLLVCLVPLAVLSACSPIKFDVAVGPRGSLKPLTVIDEPAGTDRVALIDLRGLITPPIGGEGPLGGAVPNLSNDLMTRLRLAERDSRVKAVVLRIDSPGGSVTTSDIIYEEIRRFATNTKKPVIASLGSVAASGGYYAALAADEIVAEPTSITGSIGVIIPLIDASGGFDRLGVESTSIVSGPNKDLANVISGQTPDNLAVLQAVVDDFFERFKGLVAERRPGIQNLDAVTDGSVFSGERAETLGLVDSTGTLRDAFARAKERAGLEHADLVKYGRGKGLPTPYALSEGAMPASDEARPLVDLGPIGLPVGVKPGRAYYLWLP